MKKGMFICFLLLVAIYLFAQTKPKSTSQGGVDKASVERGKTIYTTYCLACHQADGSGVPGLNPPLIKTKWVLGDKNQLITIILKGMDQPIEVDGEEYNNVMASHAFLKDPEIADVLNYVRNSFGNKASGIRPADVKAVRATVK
jgi:mono/diheme cytochrome c family protein